MNKKTLFSILLIFICLFSCSSCFGVGDYRPTTYSEELVEYVIENANLNGTDYNYYYVFGLNHATYKRIFVYLSPKVLEKDPNSTEMLDIEGAVEIEYGYNTKGSDYVYKINEDHYVNTPWQSNYTILFSNCNENYERSSFLDTYLRLDVPSLEPYIQMSKNEYNESDKTIDLYVYPNDFDITNYGLVFTRYEDSGDSVGTINIFSPLPSKWKDYWNPENVRYELDLKEFIDFTFSDVIFYNVGIFEYNSSGDNAPYQITNYFKYRFSDSYDVGSGGNFGITPLIYLSTDSPTTILTVTITTADVSEGLIYFKIDNGIWERYTEPFIIDKNCTVYAHIYSSSGSSGYSSKVITNIFSSSDISNRPSIFSDDIGIVALQEKGKFNIGWKWKRSTVNYTFLYSDSAGRSWYDFKKIATFETNIDRYMLTTYFSTFPKILYFKYIDENGFSSDIVTLTISSANASEAIRDVIVNYDESGKYLENNLHDFTNKYDPLVNPNYDKQEGSSLGGIDFSSNESLLESALKTIPITWSAFQSFFSLMNGIWIFIPNIILELIFALVLIKFFIALIGFLKS